MIENRWRGAVSCDKVKSLRRVTRRFCDTSRAILPRFASFHPSFSHFYHFMEIKWYKSWLARWCRGRRRWPGNWIIWVFGNLKLGVDHHPISETWHSNMSINGIWKRARKIKAVFIFCQSSRGSNYRWGIQTIWACIHVCCADHISKSGGPPLHLRVKWKLKQCRLSPNPKLSMTHLLTDPLTGVGARRCYCMNKRSSLVNLSNNRYSWSHGRAIHTSQ